MQIEPQTFLRLCEETGKLVFFDIESTGQKGDYNSVLCVSVKPYKKKPITFVIKQLGNDKGVVRQAKGELEKACCWVSYYGKGFDIPMLNTRLLKWGSDPVEKRLHVDLYFTLKANLLTGRRSQAHLLAWLGTNEQKMTVGADVWSSLAMSFDKNIETLIRRVESDVRGLEDMYDRTKHLIREITR